MEHKREYVESKRNNLMIRLIDIVFILLFGFIAVSQISNAEAIDPAKSTEAKQGAPDGAVILIVGVHADGMFTVDRDSKRFRRLRDLRRYLVALQSELRAEGKDLGVRIRANWDAPTRYSMQVARLCRDLGIPKGLDVVRVLDK
ncbi:MAG: biopolymer transporter ExbD [candidate division KSB1 bacterium]|nr:biopolymer transporter ExbD [candidate division KSB1 bacterium]